MVLFDLLSAVGVIACAYLLYKKFFTQQAPVAPRENTAYEEGFSDAVKYFGLRKLYEEDEALQRRMESVFADAGINHRILSLIKGADSVPASAGAGRREDNYGKPQDRRRGRNSGKVQ